MLEMGTAGKSGIICRDCRRELKESERPCSICGCPNRIYKVDIIASLKLEYSIDWKHKKPGFKRPIAEGYNRDKVSRDPELSKQEVNEVLIIDREEKCKYHKITDKKTGEIIHFEDEPLC